MSRGVANVNDVLFRQLDRLEGVDKSDPDALRAEIDRAKAVEGLTRTVIDNGKLVLEVARAGTAVGEQVRVPKTMLGE